MVSSADRKLLRFNRPAYPREDRFLRPLPNPATLDQLPTVSPVKLNQMVCVYRDLPNPTLETVGENQVRDQRGMIIETNHTREQPVLDRRTNLPILDDNGNAKTGVKPTTTALLYVQINVPLVSMPSSLPHAVANQTPRQLVQVCEYYGLNRGQNGEPFAQTGQRYFDEHHLRAITSIQEGFWGRVDRDEDLTKAMLIQVFGEPRKRRNRKGELVPMPCSACADKWDPSPVFKECKGLREGRCASCTLARRGAPDRIGCELGRDESAQPERVLATGATG